MSTFYALAREGRASFRCHDNLNDGTPRAPSAVNGEQHVVGVKLLMSHVPMDHITWMGVACRPCRLVWLNWEFWGTAEGPLEPSGTFLSAPLVENRGYGLSIITAMRELR